MLNVHKGVISSHGLCGTNEAYIDNSVPCVLAEKHLLSHARLNQLMQFCCHTVDNLKSMRSY